MRIRARLGAICFHLLQIRPLQVAELLEPGAIGLGYLVSGSRTVRHKIDFLSRFVFPAAILVSSIRMP